MARIEELRLEVLRYLGHRDQEIDDLTEEQIISALNEIEEIKQIKVTYKFLDLIKTKTVLGFKQSNLKLPGKDIRAHLKQTELALLMAVTLGHEVDKRIRYYEKIDLTNALILDACATATIEEACDDFCATLNMKLAKENKKLTLRYSPGYGDLPINIQGDFLDTLGARKEIGLTATSSNILIPRKSVTAIAGVIDINQKIIPRSCAECSKFKTCTFKRGDVGCGI